MHVEKEGKISKFWLTPVQLASSGGFSRTEINKIQKVVEMNGSDFNEAWNDFFSD